MAVPRLLSLLVVALHWGAPLPPQAQVVELNPSTGPIRSSDPEMVVIGGHVYLAADTGQGRLLLRHDPIANVQARVLEAGTTVAVTSVQDLSVAGTRLFFRGARPGGAPTVWVHDPAAGMTATMLTGQGTDPLHLTAVGTRVFFSGNPIGMGGRELWVTDGTVAGTRRVADIRPGGDSNPERLTALGGRLIFEATNGSNGREPWLSDGATAWQLADIHPTGSSQPAEFTVAGGYCYFSAADGTNGREVWRTDGTTTVMLNVRPGSAASDPTDLVDFAGTLYFAASGGIGTGTELWRTVGTSGAVQQVFDLNTGSGIGSNPAGLTVAGTALWFTAVRTNAEGRELFVYRPGLAASATNPAAVTLNLGSGDGVRQDPGIKPLGNGESIVFAGTNGITGHEPWATSGSQAVLLADLAQPGNSDPDQFLVLGEMVYFAATDQGLSGREPWRVPIGGTRTACWRILGSGCARGNGIVPGLGLAADPRLGSPMQITATGAAPQGLIGLGISLRPGRQEFGPCVLLLADNLAAVPVSLLLVANASGQGTLLLSVPGSANFLGQRVVFQAAVFEPGGPFLSIGALSNAVDAFLGR